MRKERGEENTRVREERRMKYMKGKVHLINECTKNKEKGVMESER
jgi:hypothetical protein